MRIFRLFCIGGLAFLTGAHRSALPLRPRGSAPEPASAAGSPASGRGWRAGWGEETPRLPVSRAEPISFLHTLQPACPLPAGARSAGPGNPPRPGQPTELLLHFPHCPFGSPPAPTFPSLDTRSYTHTRTRTHTSLPSLDSSSTSPCSLEMTDACRLSPNKRWGQQTTTVI